MAISLTCLTHVRLTLSPRRTGVVNKFSYHISQELPSYCPTVPYLVHEQDCQIFVDSGYCDAGWLRRNGQRRASHLTTYLD